MTLPQKLLRLLRSPGWSGDVLALIAGALTTLSFTPFDIWPLGLLSAALLYQGLHDLNGRQALWRGWCWGVGLFLRDRKSTRLNSSHVRISYAVFCLKKKKKKNKKEI